MHPIRPTCALLIALSLLAATTGCKPAPKSAAAAAPPAEVTVSRPLSRVVTPFGEFTGTTAPLEAVEVRARVTGFLDGMTVQPRDSVEPNQPIFKIDARPFQLALDNAAAQLASLQAQLKKAEFDFEKISDLYQRGIAAIDEFTKQTATRDDLRASVAGAEARVREAQLELDWCTVVAPIRGRISRNLIDAGNVVKADTTVLATIVNDDRVYAYFNASEQDVLRLRDATRREQAARGRPTATQPDLRELKWPVYAGLMTDEGYPHTGVIDYVAPNLDTATGTQQVRAVFDNADGILIAGLFVRLRVPTSDPARALMVSERALGSDQGQRYLLVVNAQNVVEYHPVTIGLLDQGLRVIESGIGPDDRVIVNGIQRVRSGMTVKPIEAPPAPARSGAATAPATTQQSSGN